MATEARTLVNEPAHKEVEEFSDAERAEWLKSGKVPVVEQEEKDLPANGDASATSKPGAGDSGKKAESGTADERPAEKRIKDLSSREKKALERAEAAERRAEAAERERDEFKNGNRKSEEKKADTGFKLLEMPVRPNPKDYKFAGTNDIDFERFDADIVKYDQAKSAYINQQTDMRTAVQQRELFAREWRDEIKTKYGEEISTEDVHRVVFKLAETQESAKAFFYHLNAAPEYIPDLVKIFHKDQKSLDSLISMAADTKTVHKAIRILHTMENDIDQELEKQKKSSENDEEPPPKKDNLSKAGKPPVEASGANASPSDDGSSEAALRRKDLSPDERGELYRERRNAEERAKRKKKVN